MGDTVRFVVRVSGSDFDTEDLTLDEVVALEKATERSWLQINPLRSALDCREILVTFRARALGREAAEREIGALGMRAALDAVRVERGDTLPELYRDGLPLPAGASGTDGSSPSPSATAGLPT